MTRTEARTKGLFKYFTNKPCSKGHNTYRYTTSGACSACVRVYKSRYSKQELRQARALIELKIEVHYDDVQAVKDFLKSLEIARGLSDAV